MGRVREEKGREEERRSEKKKSQKKEAAGPEKGRKDATVFFKCFVAPEDRTVGSLKRRAQSINMIHRHYIYLFQHMHYIFTSTYIYI